MSFEEWWKQYLSQSPKRDELMQGFIKEACRSAFEAGEHEERFW